MRTSTRLLVSCSNAFALTVALCSWPQLAHAQAWTRLGETDQVALFVNRNSIEREGYIRKVWEMQDLKQADQDGVMSRRYLNEYDCQNKMYRISQMTSFDGPKLSGKKLFEIRDVGYWRKIPPNGLFILGYVAHCVQ
jgi:hypothetical protein